jgi:iduronate 2-sulfatase
MPAMRNLSARLLTLALLAACPAASAAPQFNVLFIAADDLGNVLGRTRPTGLATPNLDRLAARGVFFERAYCQIPLCNPSRASLLTGLRPDTTGVFDLERNFRANRPDAVTLPQLFRLAGADSVRIGKIFHYDVPNGIGTDGLDDPRAWNRTINPKGRDVADERLIINPTPQRPVSAALSWLAAEGADAEQTDGLIATEAVRVLEAVRGKPFFLGVGFFRPHTPFVAPRKYFATHPLEQVTLPVVPANDRGDIPPAAIPHNIPLPHYGLPETTLREALRAYYASVAFMDAQLGRVLDALDRLQLWDSTMVVFWSDHGYHLGEHGLWQKRTLFDESARAPLILAAPGVKGSGQTSRAVVEFVDIYPTVAELAGLKTPRGLAGRSLKPLLDRPDRKWDHVAFTQILRPGKEQPVMGRAITTDRWRYIEWDEGRAGRELYDHANDPRELTNIAEDPRHARLLRELRRELDRAVQGTAPATPFNRARL